MSNKYAKACGAYKKALQHNPNLAKAYYNWGEALRLQGKNSEAGEKYREATRINPNYAYSYTNWGRALYRLGKFTEAQQHLQKGVSLLPPNDPERRAAVDSLRLCRLYLDREAKLKAFRQGKQPVLTTQELLNLASFCRRPYKQLYATSVRLYTLASAKGLREATVLQKGYRYFAARAAVLAASGKGQDANNLSEQARMQLHKQALDWLRADVTGWRKVLHGYPFMARIAHDHLQRCLTDADLASVREQKALAKLPKTQQQAWRQFWTDVQQFQRQARVSYKETRYSGTLSAKQTKRMHIIKLSAGKIYSMDLTSTQFDTYLILQDAQGNVLKEHDDLLPGQNLNSRIGFTPKQNGTYRLVATSFQGRGRGTYQLIVREFPVGKK